MSTRDRALDSVTAAHASPPGARAQAHLARHARQLWPGATAALIALVLVGAAPRPAAGQQAISEVLSFLVTNRSIPTGDFTRDEQAAAATSETISAFLLSELAAVPVSASAGGFTYRLDPALGVVVRATDSFGPFFTDRSLTAGEGRASLGISYQGEYFVRADGRSLRDGTLVSTASTLRGDPQPFDVETVTLRIRTDTMTLSGNYGLNDRVDLSAAIPLVRLTLSGQRIDTYRGRALIQATGSGSAAGIGDIVVRAKYNVVRRGGSGFAVSAESQLPTGNKENLLGAGKATIRPRAIASFEADRVTAHGDVGYSFGGLSDELDYNGALTVTANPRLTLIGEVVGRRLESFGRLTQTTTPHPTLTGVDTIRLTGTQEASQRIFAVAGVKWNVTGTWLISANILRPLTRAGLNTRWVPTVSLDYSFEQ
ncbi:MAG: hypothetical protein GEU82_12935 [Luteitalea sp.]|nr:hypothetical protein [Luteitalea sp.]